MYALTFISLRCETVRNRSSCVFRAWLRLRTFLFLGSENMRTLNPKTETELYHDLYFRLVNRVEDAIKCKGKDKTDAALIEALQECEDIYSSFGEIAELKERKV